jgi:hypothetical protein
MRTTLSLLLAGLLGVLSCAAQQISTRLVQPAAAASNSADWSKGFESGTLEAGLVETDASSKLDPAATGQAHTGTRSMSVLIDADSVVAHVRKDMGATRANASGAFWFYAPAASTGDIDVQIFTVGAASIGTQSLRIFYSHSGANYGFRFRGSTFPTLADTLVTSGAWYRLEWVYVQNGTSTLSVFDAAGAQVGSTISLTANNTACQYLYYGVTTTGTSRFAAMYYDDIGADWTDSTSPLWPYTIND